MRTKLKPEISLPLFRERPDQYAAARTQWRTLFESIVGPRAQADWEDWLRDPFQDGNPIFSKMSRRLRKGVVVNQILPSDDSLTFRAWMGHFGSEDLTDEIEHLTISCMLTDEAKAAAESLIHAYLVTEQPFETMERLCSKLTHDALELED